MNHSIDLLYLLSSFYEKVYISKPQTSRSANSEKYIVCKRFIYNSNSLFYGYIHRTFQQMIVCDTFAFRFLNVPIPNYYLTKLEEYNSIFGQQQIENIHNTICLIETKQKMEKMDMLIKTNIQKCLNWCIKFNVSFHEIFNATNAFSYPYSNSFRV